MNNLERTNEVKKYIKIKRKEDCFGCRSCEQICPKNCIEMEMDEEGFLYPSVNDNNCINCGLCESSCPIINKNKIINNKNKSMIAYAGINKDKDILYNSSSGGAFSAIVNSYCKNEFIVFGATYDENMNVIHDYAESLEDVSKFRKSKYVQSDINQSYIKVKQNLDKGKKVLFSGTPCQIAGLKMFLKKDYKNLLCIDLVCHGVPSQKIFNRYLEDIEDKLKDKVKNFSFRYKTKCKNLWNSKNISFKLSNNDEFIIHNVRKSTFLLGFHNDLFHRPVCKECIFANSNRISDITIADYWNIGEKYPDLDVHKGVSLILINNEKSKSLVEEMKKYIELIETDINFAIKSNKQLNKPTEFHEKRSKFYTLIESTSFDKAIRKCIKQKPLYRRIISKTLSDKTKSNLRLLYSKFK